MRKILSAVASLGVLLASLAVATAASLSLPAVNGPYLGDQIDNLYGIYQAFIQTAGHGATSVTTISQTSTQANCTQLGSNSLQQLKTSASTGYVCLPTALQGKVVMISNATGQSIDIYGSATEAVSGTEDYINGTIGTTAYTGLTSSEALTICMSPVNGFWYCISGT